jgi:predicted phage terminase large subunit-like protein
MDTDGMYDEVENPNGWRWINISGLCEDTENDPLEREMGESHWPDNTAFTVDMLMAQKKTMGSFAFSALYQGTPVAAEGQIVKNGWIQRIEEEECPAFDVTWLAVDCAFAEKQMADETAICVASISKADPTKVYIREIISGRWGFPDMIEAVKQAYSFYRAKMLCIEKAASGQSLIQVLKKEGRIPIHEMKPLRSKTIRLQAVTPFLESDRVYFVEGEWTDPFVKELTTFPFVRHDDKTDAFAWSLTYYALNMDVVDRGIQESILQNRAYYGTNRRPGIDDRGVFSETPRGRGRGLSQEETQYNSPDYNPEVTNGEDRRSLFAQGRRGRSRGHLGYE